MGMGGLFKAAVGGAAKAAGKTTAEKIATAGVKAAGVGIGGAIGYAYYEGLTEDNPKTPMRINQAQIDKDMEADKQKGFFERKSWE